MENKNATANWLVAEQAQVTETDGRELQDVELDQVSGGTILLDQ